MLTSQILNQKAEAFCLGHFFYYFEPVLPGAAEKEQHVFLERAHPELFFYKSSKSIDPFPEIGASTADIDLTERCGLQHDLTARRIFIRSSSLVSSDTRISAFPILMQAETLEID